MGVRNSSNGNAISSKISPCENRKANKPLMEKRRRARINQSLSMLKTLVIDNNKNEQSQKPAKLEKADILEMTVSHIQSYSKQISTDDKAYSCGYEACMRLVEQFLAKSATQDTLRRNLVQFLVSNKKSDYTNPYEITNGSLLTMQQLTEIPDILCTRRSSSVESTVNSLAPCDGAISDSSSIQSGSNNVLEEDYYVNNYVHKVKRKCGHSNTKTSSSHSPLNLCKYSSDNSNGTNTNFSSEIIDMSVWRPW